MKQKKFLSVFSMLIFIVLIFSACEKKETNTDTEEVLSTQNETDNAEIIQENKKTEETDVVSSGFSTEYTVEDAKDGYFIVSLYDGVVCALLDSYGNEVIPFGQIALMSFPESEVAEAVIIKNGDKVGLLDYEGNEILPMEYSMISNYGKQSKLYLVEKNGVQSIVELDGTIQKELSGIYTGLVGDAFLIQAETTGINSSGMLADNIYNLNEEKIGSGLVLIPEY